MKIYQKSKKIFFTMNPEWEKLNKDYLEEDSDVDALNEGLPDIDSDKIQREFLEVFGN